MRYNTIPRVLVDPCLMRNEHAGLHERLDVNLVVAVQTAWPERPLCRPKTKWSVPRTIAGCLHACLSQWSETAEQYDLVIAPRVPGGFVNMSPRRVDQLVNLGRAPPRKNYRN